MCFKFACFLLYFSNVKKKKLSSFESQAFRKKNNDPTEFVFQIKKKEKLKNQWGVE